LLYDMLLSAGGFAVYRGYLPVYKTLIPRFGSVDKPGNRRNAVQAWLKSKGFRRSGFDADLLRSKLLAECRSGGDFMRVVMNEITRNQNALRWALYDPDNVLRIDKIKADIPRALFVHMIRDGRDIALSLSKMGGFQPLPWDRRSRTLQATAMYWEWMVRQGKFFGRGIPADYIEIHYEKLVSEPQRVLKTLGQFIEHDLDYTRIQQVGMGRLSESNSSFRDEKQQSSPVNRWKEKLSKDEVKKLEMLVGSCLEECGYALTFPEAARRLGFQEKWMRAFYPRYFSGKFWLKTETPAGRLASLSELEIDDSSPEVQAAEV
jgi:Sulfotransferase family